MEKDQIKNQMRKQFSQNAEHYVTSSIHAQGEDLALLVASSQAAEHMSVLDIATGGGHVANALAPLVSRVTALDLTEGMLEAAARFIQGNGHENVDFVTGDAEHIPFPDNSFDLVTCRIAAHHFPDVSSFVSEAYRVTKPGGRLLFIDNVAPEQDELDRFYNDIEKRRDPSHVRAWRKTEWIGLLERVGYRVETMVSFAKNFILMIGAREPPSLEKNAWSLKRDCCMRQRRSDIILMLWRKSRVKFSALKEKVCISRESSVECERGRGTVHILKNKETSKAKSRPLL